MGLIGAILTLSIVLTFCIVTLVGVSLIFAFPLFVLWNWILGSLFVLPHLSILHAIGIVIIAGLLAKL